MAIQPIIIIQGGQWGSEAKGHIAAYICEKESVDIAVRTGGTNAGHTVVYGGIRVSMQQLPVGWVNPNTKLVLGAGAMIDPAILSRECDLVSRLTGADVRTRLYIDYRCGIVLPAHADRSRKSGRHHAIGATGKGCSEAVIDKIRGRGGDYRLFDHMLDSQGYDLGDTAAFINDQIDQGAKVLLEGTQGTMLDLHLGPYPYTTHKQTQPATWMAECGLSPSLPTDIVMVVRTFPIRVAGNSGPMRNEITWPALAREISVKLAKLDKPPIVYNDDLLAFEDAVRTTVAEDWAPIYRLPAGSNGLDQHQWTDSDRVTYAAALSEIHKEALTLLPNDTVERLKGLFEMTTVTKKLRRVAEFDFPTIAEAARLVRPHRVAITFMNYLWPQYWYAVPEQENSEITRFVARVGTVCRAPVDLLSFGPGPEHVIQTTEEGLS